MATSLPPAGTYTGLLTVRRTLLQEGLETSFTVKSEARIEADGRVTILTATPETPGAAANIENSVVRAPPPPPIKVPDLTIMTPLAAASSVPTPPTGNISTLPINNIGFLNFSNYLV